jgi:hypothetical protein
VPGVRVPNPPGAAEVSVLDAALGEEAAPVERRSAGRAATLHLSGLRHAVVRGMPGLPRAAALAIAGLRTLRRDAVVGGGGCGGQIMHEVPMVRHPTVGAVAKARDGAHLPSAGPFSVAPNYVTVTR